MAFFGYVDFTNDDHPFYVGIGNIKRIRRLGSRNQKHDHVRRTLGQRREVWFQSSDWTATKAWEIAVIIELKTYYRDHYLGCNFTRGGDGTLGWNPSEKTRAKWSAQRKNNTWGVGPRPLMRGKPQPWITRALKGRKRPDLALIALGSKRGSYNTSAASRFKQGATNRGKKLTEEHKRKIAASCRKTKHEKYHKSDSEISKN